MVAEQDKLQPDYQEDMTVAQYFQQKKETRDILENLDTPEFCFQDMNKLVDSILHTENMEEKTGILDDDNLKEMVSDRIRLEQMLSEKHLRMEKISNLISEMIYSQKLQQENIRQEMESLRTELIHCKNLIEQLTQPAKENVVPAMDSNLLRSKIYQIIGNVDSSRREISNYISNIRTDLSSKAGDITETCKEFAMKPVKSVCSFFSRVKETVTSMKNCLFSSVDNAREAAIKNMEDMKKQAFSSVSMVLDESANTLMELRDYINGNVPEKWEERLTLANYVKDLVERNIPETTIKKEIKRFCKDTSLGNSEILEAKRYMKNLLSERGYVHA